MPCGIMLCPAGFCSAQWDDAMMSRMMLRPAGCCCAQQDYATSAFGQTLPPGFWQHGRLPGAHKVGGAAQAGLAARCHLGQQTAFAWLCTSSSSSCNLHFKASPVLPVSPDRPCAAAGARGQGEGHSQPSQAQIPARDRLDPSSQIPKPGMVGAPAVAGEYWGKEREKLDSEAANAAPQNGCTFSLYTE